ncbi:African swine fever virus j13L [Gemmatirosa kalamazoonensis]|uniref:African swine fever virus j13L n=1 Tax=Gemmatirosa kalamazoonensis TaxID=861299 RepID=W0RPT6_9BACT|nr:prepilin-type N-terminal cleavage/methylation domain-containing protein [Gemmatirosa kalamazoonensis]AHG91523.1 African swine fever virus j13L [Gemmatirosa kalamazoonensis]
MMQNTNRKGFTLIELLIVVVIIGILAAIAIPKFSSTKEKAYMATMKADLKNLTNVQEAFYSDSGRYAKQSELTGNYLWNLSQGNAIQGVDGDATGWSAAITNPAVKAVTSCNIFAGGPTGAAATNKGSATADGAPLCK